MVLVSVLKSIYMGKNLNNSPKLLTTEKLGIVLVIMTEIQR